MAIGERIKQLRRSLDLTQKEFAERLAIKPNTIATYELGRSNPIDAVVSLICREFNVSKAWLRDGVGEMFVPAPADELGELVQKYGLTDRDRVMIEKFLSFRQEEREIMIRYVEEVADALSRLNGGRTESGNDWQDDISPRCKTCPLGETCQKRHGQSEYEDAYFQQGPQMYPGWSAHLNMPGDFPDARMPKSFANTAKCPLSQRRFQKPVVSVDAKNVHDFTPEEAHAALDEELERRKREKAGLPDSGSGNSGEDAG